MKAVEIALNSVGISIVSYSADGDSRELKVTKMNMRLGEIFQTTCKLILIILNMSYPHRFTLVK